MPESASDESAREIVEKGKSLLERAFSMQSPNLSMQSSEVSREERKRERRRYTMAQEQSQSKGFWRKMVDWFNPFNPDNQFPAKEIEAARKAEEVSKYAIEENAKVKARIKELQEKGSALTSQERAELTFLNQVHGEFNEAVGTIKQREFAAQSMKEERLSAFFDATPGLRETQAFLQRRAEKKETPEQPRKLDLNAQIQAAESKRVAQAAARGTAIGDKVPIPKPNIPLGR